MGTAVAAVGLMRRLRILTWATRPDYLRCLAQTSHEFLVVGLSDQGGLPSNVHAVAAGEARQHKLDLILFQRPQHYLDDQYELLTPAQRRAARVYLEHEPPRASFSARRRLRNRTFPRRAP